MIEVEAGTKAGIDSYRSNLRSAVRGLWRGVLTRDQFLDAMASAINRRLAQAWAEGAKDCGIKPEDYTETEQTALEEMIQNEIEYIAGFADAIQAGSQASGGKLDPLFGRANLWVNRYRDARNRAKTLACGDVKLEWFLGATELHCSTCPKLHGRVKRASEWERSGIRPQNPPNSFLECGGWSCLCELRKSDQAITKGPLPRFN